MISTQRHKGRKERPGKDHLLRFTGVLGVLVLSLPFSGAAQDEEKKKEGAPPPAQEGGRTAYIRRLYEKDRATYGEACRMALSLSQREPAGGSFDEIQKGLADRGIVDGSWKIAESNPVDRGTLAYMVCKSIGIEGGLTIRLFGMSRRYALRECIFLRIMPRGSAEKYVRGRMLIDIITDAGIYQREGSLDSVRR